MKFLDVLEPLLPALLVVAVITGLVYVGSARRARRYRPGRPFDFTPVWFLAKPEQVTDAEAYAALPAGPARAALPAGPLLAQQEVTEPIGATGGASDRW